MDLDNNQVLVVPPSNAAKAAKMITQWIKERSHTRQLAIQRVSFSDYLSDNEAVYGEVINQ